MGMKIIEGYSDIGEAATLNLSTHRFDEALRFAYGQRTELGDPSFVEGMTEYQAQMLSNATTSAVRAKLNDYHTQNVSAYDPSGFESLETPGTSAVVTSDASGMAVSLTTTINLLFGSRVMIPETGVIMNNEMNDFSIPGSSNAFGFIPSPANYIRPGKRPLSSISPSIVEHADGSLYFVVASAGGSRIITAVLQNLWHVLDQNATAAEALAAPRLHDHRRRTANFSDCEFVSSSKQALICAYGMITEWRGANFRTSNSSVLQSKFCSLHVYDQKSYTIRVFFLGGFRVIHRHCAGVRLASLHCLQEDGFRSYKKRRQRLL